MEHDLEVSGYGIAYLCKSYNEARFLHGILEAL